MKKIILTLLTAACCATLAAQNTESFNRQIEVTREYNPEVGTARKLDYAPVMVDTVTLKPEVQYQITPKVWPTAFGTSPIRPIRISAAQYSPLTPFWIRLGGGAPAQSVADFYATAHSAGDFSAGVYLNHRGRFAKIENDMGENLPSSSVRTMAGAFLEKQFGKRALDIDINYDNRFYHPYGAFRRDDIPSSGFYVDGEKLLYHDFSGSASFGDPFIDFSRFNFRVGVSGRYFTGPEKNSQYDVGALAHFGWRMPGGSMQVGASVGNIKGLNNISGYEDLRIALTPVYSFRSNNLKADLGLNLSYNIHNGNNDFYLYPRIKFTLDANAGFMPYLTFDGELGAGDFRSLSLMNPYIYGEDLPENPSRLGGKLGFNGSAGSAFFYDLFLGYDNHENYVYFRNLHNLQGEYGREANTTRFIADNAQARTDIMYIGAKLGFRIANGLHLDIAGQYNGVLKTQEYRLTGDLINNIGLGIPQFEVGGEIRYNYRDIFSISAGVDIQGEKEYTEEVASNYGGGVQSVYYNNTIPLSVNLKAAAECRVFRNFSIFAKAENLLDQRIYLFNHYPGYGINFLAGLKLAF